jgi:type II secretory pathway pseudopilin PulG
MFSKGQYGFTMIELLIYIAMSTLLSVSIIKVYVSNTKVSATQRDIADMFQNLRSTMNMMTTEIRRAGCDPLATNKGRSTISDDYLGFLDNSDDDLDTDGNSIHFTHDSTSPSDGWAYSNNENIAYYAKTVDGDKNLYRWCGVSDTEYLLVRNIKSLDFEYYDSENNQFNILQDSDRSKIRVVRITIVGETKKLKQEQTLTAYVRIRNLDL